MVYILTEHLKWYFRLLLNYLINFEEYYKVKNPGEFFLNKTVILGTPIVPDINSVEVRRLYVACAVAAVW
jgi:hypothetical protein